MTHRHNSIRGRMQDGSHLPPALEQSTPVTRWRQAYVKLPRGQCHCHTCRLQVCVAHKAAQAVGTPTSPVAMSGLLNGHRQPRSSPPAQTAPHVLQPVLAYKPSGCRWQQRRDMARRSTSLLSYQESRLQQKSWPCKRRRGPGRKGIACHSTDNGSLDVRQEVQNLVIIGSGPAGYTAAIYAARANVRPLVFEGYQMGGVRGGQLMTTTEVENFPGFPEGITGPDLMDKMRQQAERWGSELLTEDVEFVDLSSRPFTIRSSDTQVKAHSIIIATGATAKKLGIPNEEEFWNSGISACAVCDGASSGFRQQELAVVGGGDTAAEEALYLTKYGTKVHLLVRGKRMRASAAMQDRVLRHDKVQVHFNTSVRDAYGDKKGLKGLVLYDTDSGEERKLDVRGLFYGIGHQPNSKIVEGQIELDEKGYAVVRHGVQTSVEGVYAAGDLHDVEYRQAITAAGSGCMAALSAERYLAASGKLIEYHQQEKEAEPEQAHQNGTSTAPVDFNLEADKHRGQLALRKLYHESERLLVVLYTSPTCGPCRTLKPIFSKVAEEFSGKLHLVEIDIEEDPEIAQAGGINGTPTVQIFKNKERLHHLPGVKMKREYRQLIEANI